MLLLSVAIQSLASGIIGLAREADLLVQCCTVAESELANPFSLYLTESILPSTAQAGQIAAGAGVKRMVLTHLGASIEQNSDAKILEEVRQHYKGEVLLGEDLLVIE
tara:strand:- start:5110 stop:5430 length:321 start_codon:yes stop_codon:yes gene_type:complete